MEKINEVICTHRNLVHYGGLFGCADCGAPDGAILKGEKVPVRRHDPVVEKINEIVDYINEIETRRASNASTNL